MKETHLAYPSYFVGAEIQAFCYECEGTPRGIIQILHGLAEHIGRYRDFIEYFTARGYIVCGNNHLGHGEGYDETTRGYFGEEKGWQIVMEDAASLSFDMIERYPELPIIYFGHSMGSFLARSIHLSGVFCPDAMILSGTGQLPSMLVKMGRFVGKRLVRHHKGKCVESKLMTSLTVGGYGKAFKGEGEHAWISSLKEEVEAYDADPLCGYPVKLGLYCDMLDGIAFILSEKALSEAEKIPILFISGEKDPVGNMGKGVKRAFRAYAKAGFDSLSMILYPDVRHEFLHDTAKETALSDIEAWLSEHSI